MAFTNIDATKPAGTEKISTADNYIRGLKIDIETNLAEISGYPDNVALKDAIWTTTTRPSLNLVVGLSGYNTTIGAKEYWDGSSWVTMSATKSHSHAGTDILSVVASATTAASCSGNSATATYATNSGTATNANYATSSGTASYASINGIPIGGIILWYGSIGNIPAHFALCNGANGTPNLVDRFVVCAGSAYGVGYSGGAATHYHTTQGHTLTVAEMPSHQHVTCFAESDAAKYPWGIYDTGAYGSGSNCDWDNVYPWSSPTGGNASHEHGNTSTANNLPPYYALAYIMRIS